MIRRRKWKIKRNKKPCSRNNKKKRKIEKGKKPRQLDKSNLSNKRSKLKALKKQLIKPQLL
jgi:hypothetical protein